MAITVGAGVLDEPDELVAARVGAPRVELRPLLGRNAWWLLATGAVERAVRQLEVAAGAGASCSSSPACGGGRGGARLSSRELLEHM